MKKTSITIGIPAYNEEANIGFLIKQIFSQKTDEVTVDRIVVFSDGSTDRTVQIARGFKSEKVLIIAAKHRNGKDHGMNQIIQNTDSDVLVLLDADISIKNNNFLEKLVLPISKDNVDLCVPRLIEVTPSGFFEKILHVSLKIKHNIYENFNKGDNVYTCFGRARAFSRRFYKKFHFPPGIGMAEDPYSYFYCVCNGFKYRFVKEAAIIYKLPDNISDHRKQSIRFFQSKTILYKFFDREYVNNQYQIPVKMLFKGMINSFIEYPFYTILYILLVFYSRLESSYSKKIPSTWSISKSSKNLITKTLR